MLLSFAKSRAQLPKGLALMSLRRSSRSKNVVETPVQGVPAAVTAAASKKRTRKVAIATELPASDPVQNGASSDMPPPATPNKKPRISKGASTPTTNGAAPATPLKSNSNGEPTTPANGRKVAAARHIQPHQTNATLVTPRGSRIVAKPRDVAQGLPIDSLEPHETTDSLLTAACAHLVSVDPRLKDLIERMPCPVFSPEGLAEEVDPFQHLARGIISQQVSGAAADSIRKKFVALFNEGKEDPETHIFPPPAMVAQADIPRLRTAGLSQRKAEYIQGLAEKFASGELSAQKLVEGSDEEVLESLVAVRGLGIWSVQMFMCFALKRTDVFSTGDLGVQRGVAAFVGKDVAKLRNKGGKWKYMAEKDMLEVAEKFAPYRSLFMWYMWQVADVNLSAVQDS